MTPNPILLLIWAILAAAFFGLLIYRGQLTRYEDDQLFLNDDVTSNHAKEHTVLVSRLRKIEPIVRTVGGAAGLVTVCAVGLYVWDAWQHIR